MSPTNAVLVQCLDVDRPRKRPACTPGARRHTGRYEATSVQSATYFAQHFLGRVSSAVQPGRPQTEDGGAEYVYKSSRTHNASCLSDKLRRVLFDASYRHLAIRQPGSKSLTRKAYACRSWTVPSQAGQNFPQAQTCVDASRNACGPHPPLSISPYRFCDRFTP